MSEVEPSGILRLLLCQRMLFTHSALRMSSSPPFIALMPHSNAGRNANLLLPRQKREGESMTGPALEEMPPKRTNKWKHDVLNKNSSVTSFTFHLQLQYVWAEYFSLETETVSLQLKYLTRQLTTGLWKAIILDSDYFPCRQWALWLQIAGKDRSVMWWTTVSGGVN